MKMKISLNSLTHDASLHTGHAPLVHDRFSAILNFLQNTLFTPVPTDSVQIAQKKAHKKRHTKSLDPCDQNSTSGISRVLTVRPQLASKFSGRGQFYEKFHKIANTTSYQPQIWNRCRGWLDQYESKSIFAAVCDFPLCQDFRIVFKSSSSLLNPNQTDLFESS